jgi:hypothetical protein
MRGRALSLAVALFFGVTGALFGLQAAHAHPWKYGGPHGCPAGSPPASCAYPPDLHAQRTAYATNGMLLGLFTAVLVIVLVRWASRRTPSGEVQDSSLAARV